MASTWQWPTDRDIEIGEDNNVRIHLQEVVDTVPGKIYTSDSFHKSIPDLKNAIFTNIGKKINKDRAIETNKATIKATINLDNFEAFLATL